MHYLAPLLALALLLVPGTVNAQNCGGDSASVVGDLEQVLDNTADPDEDHPGYAITDYYALIREEGPGYASTGEIIPLGTEVEIVETETGDDGREYSLVREVLADGEDGEPQEWWTLASNVGSALEFDEDMVPDTLIPLDGLSGDELKMAQVYNTRGGWIESEAERLGIEPSALAAVLLVESSGNGFDNDGRMIVRFENHIFDGYWGEENNTLFHRHFYYNSGKTWTGHKWRESADGEWESFHGDQDAEWEVLEFAQGLEGANEDAVQSISMGIAQVMGFNHETLGYDSAEEMFEDFQEGIRPQLEGMVAYIENCSSCMEGLEDGDYTQFAGGYNGSGQAEYYGGQIEYWAGQYEDAVEHVPEGPADEPAVADESQDATEETRDTPQDVDDPQAEQDRPRRFLGRFRGRRPRRR